MSLTEMESNLHRFRNNRWISWLAAIACIAWTQLGILKAQPPEASVELHGVHGEQWIGYWQAMDESSIRIRSRMFTEPVTLQREFIQEILASSLPAQQPSLHEKSAHTLHWKNGSVLSGILESEQADTVTMVSPRLGKIVVPRQEIHRIESRASLIYAWSGNPTGWSAGDGAKTHWDVDGTGRFVANETNARAWMELSLPDSFVLEMTLQSESLMDFVIALGPDAETDLHLSTIGGNVILGTSDDFEIGPTLESSAREFRFRMKWNEADRKLSLWSMDGKLMAETVERTPSVKSGLLIVNQGKDLSLVSLRVMKGTDGTGHALNADNPVSSEIDERSDGTEDEVAFHDGDRLRGKVLGFQNGELRVLIGQSPTTLSSSIKDLRCIQLKKTQAPDGTGHDLLKIGGNRMQGVVEFGQKDIPIRWTSNGQIGSSLLNTSLPGSITLSRDHATAVSVGEYRDLLYLNNGDTILCRIESLDGSQLRAATPFSPVISIPHTLVKAIEFGTATLAWKHGFTRESRERLLTVPRKQRNDSFRHALLAANGDLLRGNLVNVDHEQIELDSRNEPLMIDRHRVMGIVFLAEPKSTQKTSSPQVGEAEDTAMLEETRNDGQIRLILGEEYSLSVTITGVRDGALECVSPALGRCSIPLSNISSVLTGDLPWVGQGDRYSSWETQMAPSPRWKQSAGAPNDAAKQVGSRVEDFELSMLNGEKFRLSEHSGQVVILDFWATWCGPCVMALPEYLEAVQDFSKNDVVFLGVNSSETPDTVRAFVTRRNLAGFNTLFDYDGSLGSSMGVTGIPHTLIIGPDGIVEHVHVGFTSTAAAELKAKVAEILGRK